MSDAAAAAPKGGKQAPKVHLRVENKHRRWQRKEKNVPERKEERSEEAERKKERERERKVMESTSTMS